MEYVDGCNLKALIEASPRLELVAPCPTNIICFRYRAHESDRINAQIVVVKSSNIARAAAEFVSEKHITHVIFGRSAVKGLRKYLYYWAIQHFLSEAPNVDVHIVTQHSERE